MNVLISKGLIANVISIPAYPTEVWNFHPQVLVERGLPVIRWSLLDYDEPDFWRWAAQDMLHTLGVDVHLVRNHREWIALVMVATGSSLSENRTFPGTRILLVTA